MNLYSEFKFSTHSSKVITCKHLLQFLANYIFCNFWQITYFAIFGKLIDFKMANLIKCGFKKFQIQFRINFCNSFPTLLRTKAPRSYANCLIKRHLITGICSRTVGRNEFLKKNFVQS